jgi:hypothetical protein
MFIYLCFLKEQLSRYHAKSFKEEKIRVDIMHNSLLKEIIALGEDIIPLWLVNIKHHVMIVVLCIL